jgi:hypothetical protein
MSVPILAIDLGKFNSVLCWYEPATRAATFRTTKTTPEDLRREFTRHPVTPAAAAAAADSPRPSGSLPPPNRCFGVHSSVSHYRLYSRCAVFGGDGPHLGP